MDVKKILLSLRRTELNERNYGTSFLRCVRFLIQGIYILLHYLSSPFSKLYKKFISPLREKHPSEMS
jgi:hypothetical protein